MSAHIDQRPGVRTATTKVLALPKNLSVSALERELYQTLAPNTRSPVVFDLSNCQWIEPASLVYLLAVYMARHKLRLKTGLILPRPLATRHFLEAWRFPQVFESATGVRLSQVANGEYRNYFDAELHEDNPYLGPSVPAPHGTTRLLSKYFFELNLFKRQHDLFETSFALSEATKWHRVALVLRDALRGPANLLGSRIIYEALVNAVRHPRANNIVLVSQLRRPSDRKGEMIISVWDDGTPIAGTLQNAAIRGHNIQPASIIGLTTSYLRKVEEAFSEPQPGGIVTSDQIPDASAKEEDFLLASVFPGTTSDQTGYTTTPTELGDARDSILSQPGMGLYLLANTAVSVYGGEVFLRSGHWRLRLQSLAETDNVGMNLHLTKEMPESYVAILRHYKNWPIFHGNLITVRIPLQEAQR